MTRKGKLFDEGAGYINLLWKVEKQLDAANQHIRIGLSLVRKEISRVERG